MRVTLKSVFKRLAHKDTASGKTELFCICYFWRTKSKSIKTITEQCVSCQNKSVYQKLARSFIKMKIGPKPIYALIPQRPSIKQGFHERPGTRKIDLLWGCDHQGNVFLWKKFNSSKDLLTCVNPLHPLAKIVTEVHSIQRENWDILCFCSKYSTYVLNESLSLKLRLSVR